MVNSCTNSLILEKKLPQDILNLKEEPIDFREYK